MTQQESTKTELTLGDYYALTVKVRKLKGELRHCKQIISAQKKRCEPKSPVPESKTIFELNDQESIYYDIMSAMYLSSNLIVPKEHTLYNQCLERVLTEAGIAYQTQPFNDADLECISYELLPPQ